MSLRPQTSEVDDFISSEQPWPGLAAFPESAQDFFHGRKEATGDLLRLVSTSHASVLFAQSGLGKTSLIQAGLFPVLRREDYLPIYVRLDHAEDAPPLAEQIIVTLAQTCRCEGVDFPENHPGDTLWAYFHRQNADFWADGIRLLTPVLVLDQFEEIFTIGTQSPKRQARAVAFVDDLAGLVENRPPRLIRQQIEADPASGREYDFARANFRLLISLREDFLPDFEGLMPQLPTLRLNRMRLRAMNGGEALQVVLHGGGSLVDENVSERIVRFVAADKLPACRALAELSVEPSLLSLICRELNLRRQAVALPQITASLLTDARDEILADFYARSLADLPPATFVFIEEHLLSESGYRNSFALEDALHLPQIDRDVIDTLVSRRLLRLEERSGILRVELTHDLLTEVARDNRSKRRKAAELAESRRQISINRKKTQRMGAFAAVMLMLALVMVALSWQMFQAKQTTQAALTETHEQKLIAENERNTALIAQEKTAEALKRALDAEERAQAALKEAHEQKLHAEEQKLIAENERNTALIAQRKTAEALRRALDAEGRAKEASSEALQRQEEAEKLAASGQMDIAMLGFSKKYDTWAKIVGGTAAATQSRDRVLTAQRNDILHEYFSKKGMDIATTTISGFESLAPQSHLIQLQGRNPTHSLMELELAGPGLYLLLDDLHNPARYFCALAAPNDFPILKRFAGSPGFPWEMQCRFMEAIHLASIGREADSEEYLTRALELGLLHGGDESKRAFLSNSVGNIVYFKYLASEWDKFAANPPKMSATNETRLPTWKERANLIRNVYLLHRTFENMNDRSKFLSSKRLPAEGTAMFSYIKRILPERLKRNELAAVLDTVDRQHKGRVGLKDVLDALPEDIKRQTMAELQLPPDWSDYAGWYQRRLAAQSGPAYIDGDFLKEFLDIAWVASTLQEWLKQEPDSSWAHHIEAERILRTTTGKEKDAQIDAHVLSGAASKDASHSTIQWAAYRLYKAKKYSESLALWKKSAKLNSVDIDSRLMEVLALIELGESPSIAMMNQLEAADALAREKNARPGDLAEIAFAMALIRLETGRPLDSSDALSKAYKESKECELKFFERRNWHEQMLSLLNKHRAKICRP